MHSDPFCAYCKKEIDTDSFYPYNSVQKHSPNRIETISWCNKICKDKYYLSDKKDIYDCVMCSAEHFGGIVARIIDGGKMEKLNVCTMKCSYDWFDSDKSKEIRLDAYQPKNKNIGRSICLECSSEADGKFRFCSDYCLNNFKERQVEEQIMVGDLFQIHSTFEYFPKKLPVAKILETAGNTFKERQKVYGDNYELAADALKSFFPHGIELKTKEDQERYHIFMLIVVKLSRYANGWTKPHQDSIHDAGIYSFMLEAIDQKQQTNKE